MFDANAAKPPFLDYLQSFNFTMIDINICIVHNIQSNSNVYIFVHVQGLFLIINEGELLDEVICTQNQGRKSMFKHGGDYIGVNIHPACGMYGGARSAALL